MVFQRINSLSNGFLYGLLNVGLKDVFSFMFRIKRCRMKNIVELKWNVGLEIWFLYSLPYIL